MQRSSRTPPLLVSWWLPPPTLLLLLLLLVLTVEAAAVIGQQQRQQQTTSPPLDALRSDAKGAGRRLLNAALPFPGLNVGSMAGQSTPADLVYNGRSLPGVELGTMTLGSGTDKLLLYPWLDLAIHGPDRVSLEARAVSPSSGHFSVVPDPATSQVVVQRGRPSPPIVITLECRKEGRAVGEVHLMVQGGNTYANPVIRFTRHCVYPRFSVGIQPGEASLIRESRVLTATPGVASSPPGQPRFQDGVLVVSGETQSNLLFVWVEAASGIGGASITPPLLPPAQFFRLEAWPAGFSNAPIGGNVDQSPADSDLNGQRLADVISGVQVQVLGPAQARPLETRAPVAVEINYACERASSSPVVVMAALHFGWQSPLLLRWHKLCNPAAMHSVGSNDGGQAPWGRQMTDVAGNLPSPPQQQQQRLPSAPSTADNSDPQAGSPDRPGADADASTATSWLFVLVCLATVGCCAGFIYKTVQEDKSGLDAIPFIDELRSVDLSEIPQRLRSLVGGRSQDYTEISSSSVPHRPSTDSLEMQTTRDPTLFGGYQNA